MKPTPNKAQSVTDPEADAAVKELQHGGFDMKKLSVMGKDYHTDEPAMAS